MKVFYDDGPDRMGLAGIIFVKNEPRDVPEEIGQALIRKGRVKAYVEPIVEQEQEKGKKKSKNFFKEVINESAERD